MTYRLRVGPCDIEVDAAPAARVYLLLGDPVSHSASPAMQNAAFRACGIDAVYAACRVPAPDLAAAVRDLRALAARGALGGMNLTVPHKERIVPLVDALSADAARARAVNTIRVGADARLHGENTDMSGLVQALEASGATLRAARLVVAGAGGMARAAIVAALHAGAAEVRVCNRDVDRARRALDDLASDWPGPLPALACGDWRAAAEWLGAADVFVHATPLGLRPADPLPVTLEAASPALFVCDTVYGAAATPLVRAAQARGLRAIDGRPLLLYQGARSFTLWTGRDAPVETMRAALSPQP